MTKRQWMWIGIGAIFLVGFFFLFKMVGTHTVTITEPQLKGYVASVVGKEFPVKGAGTWVKTAMVKSADVSIEGDKLHAVIEIEGTLRANKKFNLSTNAVGVPFYQSGEFFFKPEKVEVKKWAYQGASPAEIAEAASKRYVTDEGLKNIIKDAAPKIENWVTSVAQSALVHAPATTEIYTLKSDAKGIVVKAALDSVVVDKNEIKIVFSLWQLTVSAFIGFALLLIGIALAWGLITHPGVGLTMLAVLAGGQ